MGAWIEKASEVAAPLSAGVRAKGEYRCETCAYGVTVHRELPRCPMCGSGSWEALDWRPFTRSVRPVVAGGPR
jgi:Zn finger protein HypA/HybF involved in hydrogenase expression